MTLVEVGTIREIQQRLSAEGFHVSTYALRQWIKAGILPAIYSGKKALISYTAVLNLLIVSTAATTPA